MKDYTKSVILNKVRMGESLKDELIIDSHTHIGSLGHLYIPFKDEDGVIEHMDRLGINRACVFSYSGFDSDYVIGNDDIIRIVKKYPDRFIGYTFLNPSYGLKDMIKELERCINMGLRGIKLYYGSHPWVIADLMSICEYANEKRLIILSHCWPAEKKEFNRILKNCSKTTFIIGHAGEDKDTTGLLKKYGNLFRCTAASREFGEIHRMVSRIGSDKILYGSDLTYIDGAFGIGPIAYAKISDTDKRKILGLNMEAILRIHNI